ncbi:hypothetical protein Tco_1382138, partial [Tanacetum coccineum]
SSGSSGYAGPLTGPCCPCSAVRSAALNSLISADLLWSALCISEVTVCLLRSAACNSLISDI